MTEMDSKEYRIFLVKHGLRTPPIAKSMNMSAESLNRKVRDDVMRSSEIERLVHITGMSQDEFLDIFYPKANL